MYRVAICPVITRRGNGRWLYGVRIYKDLRSARVYDVHVDFYSFQDKVCIYPWIGYPLGHRSIDEQGILKEAKRK